MNRLASFDPFDPAVVEDPRAFFAALRREAPVYELPNGAYWLVSCYEDVRRAALDPDTFSSNLVAVLLANPEHRPNPALLELPSGRTRPVDVLAIADGDAHARQRKRSNQAFSARRVQALEPWIRELTEACVTRLIEAGGGDWVAEVAVPVPMAVIARLVGVPDADVPRIKRWSDASVALLSGIHTAEALAAHASAVVEFLAYLAELVDDPAKASGDDVLGDLIRATREPAPELGRDEVVSILVQLLTAGNETTTSLIGSALMLLLRDPELEKRLREDPGRIPAFLEEVLRLESPFHGHFRVVRRDTELAGVPLAEGSRLMLLWASANRDERHFERADALDLDRENPRRHLAFGVGVHHCLGAALARLEARVVLETLLARTRTPRLAPNNDFAHVPSLFIRSLKKLSIELD